MRRSTDEVIAIIAAVNSLRDHMDARFAHMDARFDRVDQRIDRIIEDIAGMKIDLATHTHDEQS